MDQCISKSVWTTPQDSICLHQLSQALELKTVIVSTCLVRRVFERVFWAGPFLGGGLPPKQAVNHEKTLRIISWKKSVDVSKFSVAAVFLNITPSARIYKYHTLCTYDRTPGWAKQNYYYFTALSKGRRHYIWEGRNDQEKETENLRTKETKERK
jgi:hypothetical protein